LSRRPEGHRIRIDILLSTLQKGIRRSHSRTALYALALLCRSGLYREACHALIQCCFEETNALTEPQLRRDWLKMAKRLLAHLSRKGVDLDTEMVRKLFFDLCMHLVTATKSRLAFHSMVASYNILVSEAKDLRIVADECGNQDQLLVYGFKQFKKAFQDKDEMATLKWATVVDLFGQDNDVYGTAKLWRFLTKYHTVGNNLDEFAQVPLVDPYTRRLVLYEALLLHFYPTRADTKKKNFSRQVEQQQWNWFAGFFDRPLEPRDRQHVDWDEWLPIVLDITTASGKNRDTVTEVKLLYPEFPFQEYTHPDSTGVTYPSFIVHNFAVCQQLKDKILSDPYEGRSRTFLAQIERGQSLPIFGKGIDATGLFAIRKGLKRLLFNPATKELSHTGIVTFQRSLTDKKRLSVTSTDSSTDSSIDSIITTPLLTTKPQRSLSSDVRSHSTNKAPSALPGFTVQSQSVVSGPIELDGMPVTYCELLDIPVVGQYPRWFVGLPNRTSWIVQRTSEMLATVPLYLDSVKSKFGLPNLGVRFVDNVWLVLRDPGTGGPYPTQIKGTRRYEIVQQSDAGLLSLEEVKLTDNLCEQLLKTTLFLALFRIQNVTLTSLVVARREMIVYSWTEWSTLGGEIPPPPFGSNVDVTDILFRRGSQEGQAYKPGDPIVQPFRNYCTSESALGRVRHLLAEWKSIIPELPHPPRPVQSLPNKQTLLNNLQTLCLYWKLI